MKERRKRVKRVDGSCYRSKSKRSRWGTEGRERTRGRERWRDWSSHERWQPGGLRSGRSRILSKGKKKPGRRGIRKKRS